MPRQCAVGKISREVGMLLRPSPPSQWLFCSQWRWLYCLPGVYYCLLLQFVLLRRFLQSPWASYLFRLVPWVSSFWHHMSHFLTGQLPYVLYSTVSLLSSVRARHRNLGLLPPLLPTPRAFLKDPLFPSSWRSYSGLDMLFLCPVHRVTFVAGDIIH